MSNHSTPYIPRSSTSHAAATAIRSSSGSLREEVFQTIKAAGLRGLTDEEGIAETGMNPSTYRPRRIELQGDEQKGLPKRIIDLGERRKTCSGRYAVVWFAIGMRA